MAQHNIYPEINTNMENFLTPDQQQQIWEDFTMMQNAEPSNSTSQDVLQPLNSAHTSSHLMPAQYTQNTECIAPQDTLLENAPVQQHQEVLQGAGAIHDDMTAGISNEDVTFFDPLNSRYDNDQPLSASAQQSYPEIPNNELERFFPDLVFPRPSYEGEQQQLPGTAAANDMYGVVQDAGFIPPPAPSYPPSFMPMAGPSTYNHAPYQPVQQGSYFAPAPLPAYATAPQPQLQPEAQLHPAPFPLVTTDMASSPFIYSTASASSLASSSTAATNFSSSPFINDTAVASSFSTAATNFFTTPFINDTAVASSSTTNTTAATNDTTAASSSHNSAPRRSRASRVQKNQTEHTCKQAGCPYKTRNKEEFRRHTESVHQKIRRHRCDICKSSFNDASGLSKHRKTDSHQKKAEALEVEVGERLRYACRFCVKQGVRTTRLRRADHLKRHLKECKNCEKEADGLPKGYSSGIGGMDNGILRGAEGFEFLHSEVS